MTVFSMVYSINTITDNMLKTQMALELRAFVIRIWQQVQVLYFYRTFMFGKT